MTMVVCFTLSSAKDLPSSMAETKLHVPCSPSRSFLVADSSGFMTTFNKTGSRLAHELFHKIRGDATSHQRLTQEASVHRRWESLPREWRTGMPDRNHLRWKRTLRNRVRRLRISREDALFADCHA